MKYLVDTDWVADYLQGRPAAQTLFQQLSKDGIAISIITYSEIYEGILAGYNPQTGKRVFRAFLKGATVLSVSRAVAEVNASIRAQLRAQRKPVSQRALDLLIAA